MQSKSEGRSRIEEPQGRRLSGAVEHVAAVGATFIVGLGICQCLAPDFASALTGLEAGMGAQIVGVQWIVFGGLLAAGGLLRVRALTIFAAEFVMISALAALLVTAMNQADAASLAVHAGIALVGFASSGLARLTDKADLKRELFMARELARSTNAATPVQSTPIGGQKPEPITRLVQE